MILNALELALAVSSIVPWWMAAAATLYRVIAFLTGCPFCAMPNMDWPWDLVREIRTTEYDQDLVTEHRRSADDT